MYENQTTPSAFPLALLVAIISPFISRPAHAQTNLMVSSLADNGVGSLREAIANAPSGATIEVTSSGTITLTSGELLIGKDLNIRGPGATALAISGNNSSRVFSISNATVGLHDLTIRDGRSSPGQPGGGIYNAGNLTVSECVLTNNHAGDGVNGGTGMTGGAGGDGGAIYNHSSGVLTATRCTISGNASGKGGTGGNGSNASGSSGADGGAAGGGGKGGDGGGLYSLGTLTLDACLLSENATGSGGNGGLGGDAAENLLGRGGDGGLGGNGGRGGLGGGLCAYAGEVTMKNCTLSGNLTGSGGNGRNGGQPGGGWTSGDGGYAGNGGAGGGGAGINIQASVLTSVGCTIANNTTGSGGTGGTYRGTGANGAAGLGGGINNVGSAESAQLVNTIVARNTNPSGVPDDVRGAFSSLGHNLVGNDNGSVGFGAAGDLLNVDPLLWPLASYKGPTLTCALSPNSPAIDAGDDSRCGGSDQRGVSRPRDGDGDSVAHCDIGAYEAEPLLLIALPATLLTQDSARLEGLVKASLFDSVVWFEWGLTPSHGSATPIVQVGHSSSDTPINATLTGLNAGDIYHYRVGGSNSLGVAYSDDRTFIIPCVEPSVFTLPASSLVNDTATFNGSVNPGGAPTAAWFEWGIRRAPGIVYDQSTAPVAVGNGTNALAVAQDLASLTPGLVYHFRLVASNRVGVVRGADQCFWTPALTLNGPTPLINESHTPFADPGASVSAAPTAIAAGGLHNLALRPDGTVVGWGDNSYGQANGGLAGSQVVATAAGMFFSLALRANGTVVAWGWNDLGQTDVPAGLSNGVAIAAGYYHCLALKTDGRIVGWGRQRWRPDHYSGQRLCSELPVKPAAR